MSEDLVLRVSGDRDAIDLAKDRIGSADFSSGFTFEAWVRPASLEPVARLYPEADYKGAFVRLKVGLYHDLASHPLPQLGSLRLPEGIEAVIFSEPDFKGEAFAARADMLTVPGSHTGCGSVVVLDRSHRRQNHVVIFEKPGYTGRAQVVVLPQAWQDGDGVGQVGSAWVPPGVALEMTAYAYKTGAAPPAFKTAAHLATADELGGSADGQRENGESRQPVRGYLPDGWDPDPESDILFLFEKPDYQGKRAIITGKQLQPGPDWLVQSAVLVKAGDGLGGAIGFGPKTADAADPELRFFATGESMPADAVNWQFWVPPDHTLVPVEPANGSEYAGNGLIKYKASTGLRIKRASAARTKDFAKIPAGVKQIERGLYQDHLAAGKMSYRSGENWVTVESSSANWLQDVPALAIVDIPKGNALFLFKKALGEIQAEDDYEILAEGTYDLTGLASAPLAAIFIQTPEGSRGVLSFEPDGKVFSDGKVLADNISRSLWVPPGFQVVRTSETWQTGFYRQIAAADHRAARIRRFTQRGDLSRIDEMIARIETRRDVQLQGSTVIYTTKDEPARKQELALGKGTAPAFASVRVPAGTVLVLFQTDDTSGDYQVLTVDRDDLTEMPWAPGSFLFAEAPDGPDGVVSGDVPQVVVPGSGELTPNGNTWLPDGYRFIRKNEEGSVEVEGARGTYTGTGDTWRVERFEGVISLENGVGLVIERVPSQVRGAPDELRFGGAMLRPDLWYHLGLTWDSAEKHLSWYLNARLVRQEEFGKAPLNEGGGAWALGQYFRGEIARVRVWDKVRTAEQIAADRYAASPADEPLLDRYSGMEWASLGEGVDGEVHAAAFDAAGNLYVGGRFAHAGGKEANHIARWDGREWQALGDGVDLWVHTLAFDAAGNLYAGGEFTHAGGKEANRIAVWDGTAWQTLGTGFNRNVLVLRFDSLGNLFAGGYFDQAGGNEAQYIAMWNGSEWQALGPGLDNPAAALAFDRAGNLYAGGYFGKAGGKEAKYIAKWDGNQWQALGGGVDNKVYAATLDGAGNLFVGGDFTRAGGQDANYIARWDADSQSWQPLGAGAEVHIQALAVDADGRLYAGGYSHQAGETDARKIALWDGNQWHALGEGVDGNVRTLAFDSVGDLYAGGLFTHAGGKQAGNIAVWRSVLPQAPEETVLYKQMQQQVAAENQKRMLAAHLAAADRVALAHKQAQRKTALAREARRDIHIQGIARLEFVRGGTMTHDVETVSGWSAVGMGVNDIIRALAFDAQGNLYAGGDLEQADGTGVMNIAMWGGGRWHALGTGVNHKTRALAMDAQGNLYAGGNFTEAGGVEANYVARWDGIHWHALGQGVDGEVNALAVDAAGRVYAGVHVPSGWDKAWSSILGVFSSGSEADGSDTHSHGIAMWDGSQWHGLGAGVDGQVRALAFDAQGNLYAGGDFTKAGEQDANHIARWDGSHWRALGEGVDDNVWALAADAQGNLYAGGDFTKAGQQDAGHVARWDGSQWHALGTGVGECVNSLAFDAAGNLYAGGDFSGDEDDPRGIARWDGDHWNALGEGVNDHVYALAISAGGNLYAGGRFMQAGGIDTPYLARWQLPFNSRNLRITDLVIDAEGRRYASLDGMNWHIRNLENTQALTPELPQPPRAAAVDFGGKNPEAENPGADAKVRTGLYWIEADGMVCRSWLLPGGEAAGERVPLFGGPAPLGRAGVWDMAVDMDRQRLFWTNGRELYWSDVSGKTKPVFEILVPQAVTPFPVAVAVAPDGSLLWLDAEDETMRMLPYDPQKDSFGETRLLFSAPRPARGLAVSRLGESEQGGGEVTFIYWVSADRRTLEVPVLDTPGQYIDLGPNPHHPHGQGVAVVPVDALEGVGWRPADVDTAPNQANPQSETDVLVFTNPEDVVVFDPVRLDLHQGLMAEAVLSWNQPADGRTPVCVYELSTFEDEERIVCGIETDGRPVLHMRWEGRVRHGSPIPFESDDKAAAPGLRLTPGERHRVTWVLDGRGVVTTWIDGKKVVQEQADWPGGVEVFEGHCLGAPNSAQTHHGKFEGALMKADDDPLIFTGFQGRLFSFCAWNTFTPPGDDGWTGRTGPDLTWARSLATVESKRRYLQAGRLDGKEPPVTLFPIEMDGGLIIETSLELHHAELTFAHAQKAAAEAHAARLKQDALDKAKAELAAADAHLADTQQQADSQLADARDRRSIQQAQARAENARADADAQAKRSQGQRDAESKRADGQAQAQGIKERAADDKNSQVTDANRRLRDARD